MWKGIFFFFAFYHKAEISCIFFFAIALSDLAYVSAAMHESVC